VGLKATPQLKPGEKALPIAPPNAGIEAEYRRALKKLIKAMNDDVLREIRAAYKENPPVVAEMAQDSLESLYAEFGIVWLPQAQKANKASHEATSQASMAMDALPATELKQVMAQLNKKWNKRFNAASEKLAKYFAQSVEKRSSAQLTKILRDAGIAIDFKLTKAQQDILQATVQENVALIKSIPSQYLQQVQGTVMRSVSVGKDLHGLTQDLQKHYGVTERRATIIARDQTRRAHSMFNKARFNELGIEEGIWRHSHAGKTQRKTHVAQSGKRFSIKLGWYDPDPKVRRRIQTGELINCRCTTSPIIPALV